MVVGLPVQVVRVAHRVAQRKEKQMSWHYAPIIREMEEARITLLNIIDQDSVGFTRRSAAEGVTQPTPIVTANGGIGNFWFLNQQTTPSLG
jgi:hypothetical protein